MTDPRVSEPMWGGVTDRECDEHRTTGQRAWCFDCRAWCYPATPCRGCETSWLRQRIKELEAERELVRERILELSRGVTDRGRGHVWWCCDAPFVPLGDSPHKSECFLTGAGGLLELAGEPALPSMPTQESS